MRSVASKGIVLRVHEICNLCCEESIVFGLDLLKNDFGESLRGGYEVLISTEDVWKIVDFYVSSGHILNRHFAVFPIREKYCTVWAS
jgi:hypothetical protein